VFICLSVVALLKSVYNAISLFLCEKKDVFLFVWCYWLVVGLLGGYEGCLYLYVKHNISITILTEI